MSSIAEQKPVSEPRFYRAIVMLHRRIGSAIISDNICESLSKSQLVPIDDVDAQISTAAIRTRNAPVYRRRSLLGCGAVIEGCRLAGLLDILVCREMEDAEMQRA